MSVDVGPATLSLQELRNATELLEGEGVAAGRLTAAQLDARRPGSSPEYAGTTPSDWLAYYGWLAGQCAAPPPATRPLEQVKAEAAADAPLPVRLTDGTVVAVQPKSAYALLLMRGLDAEWRALGPSIAVVLSAEDPAPAAVHAAVWASVLEARSLRLWLWCATDGIGLPFDPTDPDPPLPAWTAIATAADLAAIWRAHLQVNHEDLGILAAAFPRPTGPSTARAIEDVVGAIAQERGQPTRQVYCLESARSLYQQALAAALLHEDARRRAATREDA